ncbi:MAG: DUF4157 domain-containing protein [Alphaproteobacteria bacterium]|nr:DUF4157 domain-containing protein [Alphaproteobacteria bacterium]
MLAPPVAKPPATKAPPRRSARLPGSMQYKLMVGPTDDPLEREADSISERVMRMPASAISASSAPLRISRKCAACAAEDETIHRAEVAGARPTAGAAPDIVHEVLRGPGKPLDPVTRAFFEPRFGHDFGRVRVHHGEHEAASAAALQARAYAVGERIVFGRGEYAPSSQAGRQLLAHELAHVVQQGAAGSARRVQRRLVVDPAAAVPLPAGAAGPALPLTISVQGLMRDICPTGGASVDTTSGVASLTTADFCTVPAGSPAGTATGAARSRTPAGCGCLCDVIGNTETTTISFRAGGPGTSPGSVPAGTTPHPGQGGTRTSPTVTIDPRFQGQYFVGGRWVDVPFHLLFAHEVCGHALPKMLGTHVPRAPGPAGGTPPQEVPAVAVERAIAAEQGLPRRPDDYSGAARQRP